MLTIHNGSKHFRCFIVGSMLVVSGFASVSTAQLGIQESFQAAVTNEATDLKRAYERELAQIERNALHIIEDALSAARQKADEMRQREIKAAREKLLANYAEAIAKALAGGRLREASALTAERQSLEGLQLVKAGVNPNQLDDGVVYRCVLGQYSQFGGSQHPVVNLSIPNKSLWSDTIQDKLRGKIDFKEISYQGDAHLAVMNEGDYTCDFPQHTRVELNGNDISAGDVHL
jgi:hypothetical protein